MEEIRTTDYYERAKASHPDATGSADATEFLLIRAAYEILVTAFAKNGESHGSTDGDERDFATEWRARESELAAIWRKLREDWLSKPLMVFLLQQVEQQVNSYSSVSQLRESIRKDVPRVISEYLLHVNHELQADIGRVTALFNQKVNEMYFPLFEQVRTLRLSHLIKIRYSYGQQHHL